MTLFKQTGTGHGTRYKPVIDCTGKYYNVGENGKEFFTDGIIEETTVGICIMQTMTKRTICALNPAPGNYMWDKAMDYNFSFCKRTWYIPTIEELIWARTKFPKLFNRDECYWSSTVHETNENCAYVVSGSDSYCWTTLAVANLKYHSYNVLPFCSIPI